MKKKVLHSIFSIVLMVIILLPFTIQTVHVLHGHAQEICTAKDVKHIDQHQANCSSYHQIIEQNSIAFLSEFNLEVRPFFNYNPTYFHQSQYNTDPQLKSSRGPPNFII